MFGGLEMCSLINGSQLGEKSWLNLAANYHSLLPVLV